MKIRDLIAQLTAYPHDTEVYLSGDPEGNDIRTIDEVAERAMYDTEADMEAEKPSRHLVVIWPTNTVIDDNSPKSTP